MLTSVRKVKLIQYITVKVHNVYHSSLCSILTFVSLVVLEVVRQAL